MGNGKKTYDSAKALLMRWGHFQLGWAEVAPDTKVQVGCLSEGNGWGASANLRHPIELPHLSAAVHQEVDLGHPSHCLQVGTPVTVVAKTLFLWTANPLKIMCVAWGRAGAGGRGRSWC